MADIELTRFAFLRKGFECPVQGCGEKVTYFNIEEGLGVAIGQQVPTGYLVRCPRCGTQHSVQITNPEPRTIAEQELTRYTFLHKGFTCPVDGCGETISARDAEQTNQNISQQPPSLYVVRCPRCRTQQVVHIIEKREE